MNSVSYEGMIFDEYISKEEIAHMVQEVADRIAHDYQDKKPILICVLHGAVFFLTDLMRALPIDCTVATVHLQSYDGVASTGQVRENVPLQTDIRDKVKSLNIEFTCSFKQILRSRQPRSIKVAALLTKPTELQYPDAKPDYCGREIPKKFVIGYGFDIHDYARNLPAIYALREA